MNRYIILVFAFFILGCGSSKKTVLKAPNTPDIGNSRTKINNEVVTIPKVSESIPAMESMELPPVMSTKVRVEALMREGFNKRADWTETIHYDVRRPHYVIIHHTAQNGIAQTIRTFQLEHTKVSSHYIIGRDGRVVQMLNDYLRSWHAGKSKWGNITDMNSVSLGIELDNNGKEPFSNEQIESLLTLLEDLKTKYRIPFTNFIGHADIAPTRKNDPSVHFPWKRLAENGFGVWYDEHNLVPVPEGFNYIDALRIIGYDVSNLRAAIIAFKRKFIVTDVGETMSDFDMRVLYNLYRRYF